MDVPSSPAALQSAALTFLRRFGLVCAGWTTLLALTAPAVRQPTVLWVGVAALWAWALASQAVRPPRAWFAGWVAAAVLAELLGPLAGTDGWSLAGGASFIVLSGAALSGRRTNVVAVVALLSLVALGRGVVAPGWNVGGGVSTLLIFGFGGLALAWLVRVVQGGQEERDRLAAAVAAAETDQAVAHERVEAAARLHDSVLQTLTAITRETESPEARRLAEQASTELRSFLRRARAGGHDEASFAATLDAAVTAAAAGRQVTFSTAGDAPVDTRTRLLVDATVEAVRNAVAHTDGPVRVYAESTADTVTVWVRDHGSGFDLDDVPADRLGVRGSIVGRLERAGGTATLTAGADGAEWALVVPRT
ncbi:MAG: sensor histidine kinase [Actinomycetes bacterium]